MLGAHADDHLRGHVRRCADVDAELAEHESDITVPALGADAGEAHRRAADEACDERVRGSLVDRIGIADLLEDAVAHRRDAVAHRHRLDLVVRDVDRRRPDLALQTPDLRARLRAQLRVEVRQRLVHEEHLRLAHERTPERHALALPARQRARLAIEQRLDPEQLGGLVAAAADLGSAELANPEPEGEVLPDAHLRIERVILEHHRDVALARRDVVDDPLADPDAPGTERLEAREHPQRRRLARARRPDEHHELAVLDRERELRHGGRLAEALRHLLERDARHQPLTAPVSMPRMKWRCRKT